MSVCVCVCVSVCVCEWCAALSYKEILTQSSTTLVRMCSKDRPQAHSFVSHGMSLNPASPLVAEMLDCV